MKGVVVTGMGAITPIGNNVVDMWKSMINGKHGIAPITHFDTEGFSTVIAAEVKGYQPSLYMDKKDIQRYDPFTIFAMGAASQAVEQSGIIEHINHERIGVYFSTGIGGLFTLENSERVLLKKGPAKVPAFSVPAMISNSAAAMIAIKYHCLGSCMAISTACASSGHAIGEAYRAIRHGYADAIIAGGFGTEQFTRIWRT